jgi:hypothetical protein
VTSDFWKRSIIIIIIMTRYVEEPSPDTELLYPEWFFHIIIIEGAGEDQTLREVQLLLKV